jgi:hypothetical protein
MVLNLSWPSKSFVESDTTVSGDLARHEMFPDGGIVANVPSIGDCVILLSQEEFHALELLPAVHSRSPTNRCEHVLSTMLEALSSRHDSTGDGIHWLRCESRPMTREFDSNDHVISSCFMYHLRFSWPAYRRVL